jgi:hypothetical protein
MTLLTSPSKGWLKPSDAITPTSSNFLGAEAGGLLTEQSRCSVAPSIGLAAPPHSQRNDDCKRQNGSYVWIAGRGWEAQPANVNRGQATT